MSVLLIGGGQFYNEQALKGLMMMAGAIIAVVVVHPGWWLAIALGSAVDAYQYAKSGASFLD